MQPCKTLLINTHIVDKENVQRDIKKEAKKRENLQDVKLAQTICQNLFMSKIDYLY
jgi:hypothetical protein